MGTVWLAHDKTLDRDVAIKQVFSTAGLDIEEAQQLRESAMREGRNAARLSNPHTVSMYDVTLDRGEPWLVMEYLPSCSLAQVLGMTGTLPTDQVAQIGAQVADAMAEAHAGGILHRDIKPGNILIADRGKLAGTVKISDFGISRANGEFVAGDDTMITGTPAYIAPEVARGYDPSEASEVFSLGAALYAALEGQPPFGIDDDAESMMDKAARGEIVPPQHTGPLTDVLLRMLEPDPKRRPTMTVARGALAATIPGAGGSLEYVLNSPLRASDGRIPVWVRRASAGGRRAGVPGGTVGGLPPAPQSVPLDRVPRPQGSGEPLPLWRTTAPVPPRKAASPWERIPLISEIPRDKLVPAAVLAVALIIIVVMIVIMV
ncbi:protein kinase [Rhodococcus sp. D2-41]|nr:protein kinase [Rhodococcus sp. D2-41]